MQRRKILLIGSMNGCLLLQAMAEVEKEKLDQIYLVNDPMEAERQMELRNRVLATPIEMKLRAYPATIDDCHPKSYKPYDNRPFYQRVGPKNRTKRRF